MEVYNIDWVWGSQLVETTGQRGVVGVLAVADRVNRVNTHHGLAADKKAGQPKGILLPNTEAQVAVAGA